MNYWRLNKICRVQKWLSWLCPLFQAPRNWKFSSLLETPFQWKTSLNTWADKRAWRRRQFVLHCLPNETYFMFRYVIISVVRKVRSSVVNRLAQPKFFSLSDLLKRFPLPQLHSACNAEWEWAIALYNNLIRQQLVNMALILEKRTRLTLKQGPMIAWVVRHCIDWQTCY